MKKPLELLCRSCGSRIEIELGAVPEGRARECLVCPVCWATGPALDDAAHGAKADEGAEPVVLGRLDGHRLLGCVRPGGPELEGASRAERELARMLWRLAEV